MNYLNSYSVSSWQTSLVFTLALIFFVQISFANEAIPVAEDPILEKRLIELSENLRCLVCQNESLAGSRADFANDLRREIREQMKANKSDEEIIDFLVARYGDFVLYNPPFKPTTILLWLGPVLLFLGAILALVLYLRRRRSLVFEEPQQLSESQQLEAETLIRKIEKE